MASYTAPGSPLTPCVPLVSLLHPPLPAATFCPCSMLSRLSSRTCTAAPTLGNFCTQRNARKQEDQHRGRGETRGAVLRARAPPLGLFVPVFRSHDRNYSYALTKLLAQTVGDEFAARIFVSAKMLIVVHAPTPEGGHTRWAVILFRHPNTAE